MNKVILMGRLTRDPETRYCNSGTAVARYTLAIDRYRRENGQSADFINCVAFGKTAEVAEQHFYKGLKVVVTGHLQTGSYKNREGQTIRTTDVVIESQEFAESKSASSQASQSSQSSAAPSSAPSNDGFMNIPDGIDEELPFN